jgi:hypothetical protein
MRTGIAKGILAGALWLLADAAPVWPQSSAAAIYQFIGGGEHATSTLGALAAQHQALELQREQARQMQQTQQFQQDQAAAQSHHCQPGYTGALIVHADGTRELICEQRR